MTGKRVSSTADMSRTSRAAALSAGFVLLTLTLPACSWWGLAVDLAPSYQPPQYVVPISWRGSSPFMEAKPADSELRPDWWKLYDDPVLNRLIEQALAANPDLQAAAERFVQARYVMMKARSQYIPQVGLEAGASHNRQSFERLFRPDNSPLQQGTVDTGGIASWEPAFWSDVLVACLAARARKVIFFCFFSPPRGYDAPAAIYSQSIALYKQSLNLVQ